MVNSGVYFYPPVGMIPRFNLDHFEINVMFPCRFFIAQRYAKLLLNPLEP